MKKYNTNFSNEDLHKALHSKEAEAEDIIRDEKKWEKLKSKIIAFLSKAEKIPVIGGFVDDIECMIYLVDSYIKKEYREIPTSSITAIVAALLYLASPIDLVPDAIPVVGYIDDAAILMLVLNLGVNRDLDKYKNWNESNRISALMKLKVAFSKEIIQHIENYYVSALILSSDETIKILLNEKENPADWDEYCVKQMHIPRKLFDSYNVISRDEIIDFIDDVIGLDQLKWVEGADKKAYLEYDFNWDNYIIREE